MKVAPSLLLIALGVAASAAVLHTDDATAASASASASAKVAPASSGVAQAGAWPPDDTKTDRPSEADWETAAALALTRPHRTCTAKHLREWVRVECPREKTREEPWLGVRVVGGDHVDVRVANPKTGEKYSRPIAVVFPARRGDRRVLELAGTDDIPFKSFTVYESLEVTVSELWLEGEPAPTISVF